MVIAAPVFEEILFRGIILKGLLNKYSPVTAIVISSILFGIAHMNPWQFIAAFTIGIFVGWIYYRTSSLLLAIVIHATANLTGFVMGLLYDVKEMIDVTLTDYYGGVMNLVLVIGSSLLLAVLGVYLIRSHFLSVDRIAGVTEVDER